MGEEKLKVYWIQITKGEDRSLVSGELFQQMEK